MKKIIKITLAATLFLLTSITASAAGAPCDSIPQEVLAQWNTLSPAVQQGNIDAWCGGGQGGTPSLSGQGGTPALEGQGGTPAPNTISTQLKNPIKYDTFSSFVSAVTRTAVQILLPFIVLAFIYSGFLFIKAQGNEEGLTEAKKAITWSMVGAFILLGAWGFGQIIGQTITSITK